MAAERARLVSSFRPTSFFDALYRIRARSNYRDVDSFAFGTTTVAAAQELHIALAEVIYQTLFMLELVIARSIGKRDFSSIVRQFLGSTPGPQALHTIDRRWQTIKNHV